MVSYYSSVLVCSNIFHQFHTNRPFWCWKAQLLKKVDLKIKYAVSKPPVSDIGKDYIIHLEHLTFFTIKVSTRWASWMSSQRILFFENAFLNSQQFIILFPAYNGEFSILGKGIILVLEEVFFFEWHWNSLWLSVKLTVRQMQNQDLRSPSKVHWSQ